MLFILAVKFNDYRSLSFSSTKLCTHIWTINWMPIKMLAIKMILMCQKGVKSYSHLKGQRIL